MFTLPIYDDNPAGRPAFMTWAAMLACILVFLWQSSLPPDAAEMAFLSYGLVPAV